MTRYIIECNEAQMQILSGACELLARLGIGQFRGALEYMPTREFRPDGWNDDMDAIGRMLSRHMHCGVDGYSSSLGINHEKTPASARVSWDLHTAFRHRLALDRAAAEGVRDSSEMMGVHFDPPSNVSGEPAVTVRRVGDADE